MKLVNRFLLLCGTLLCLVTTPASAQQDKLPEGKQVVAQYIQAIGGEEKIARIKSMQSENKLSFVGTGISGTMKMELAEGGKFLQEMQLEGIGSERAGSDGTTIWSSSAITGARLLEGEEADQMKLSNNSPVPQIGYSKHFDTIECTGVEKFDDVDCYVVKFVKGDLKPVLDFYEKTTGLLRGSRQTIVSPQGEFEIETKYSDYREVEGIKFPFSAISTLGPGQSMELQTKEMKLNTEFASGHFALPEEIKSLKK